MSSVSKKHFQPSFFFIISLCTRNPVPDTAAAAKQTAAILPVSGASANGEDAIPSKQDEFVKEIQAQTADAADWDSFDDDGVQW